MLKEEKHFSPWSYAGGVTFKGIETFSGGAFGMDFHQPDYQGVQNGEDRVAQTTPFQERLQSPSSAPARVERKDSQTGKIDYVTIVDIKGNSYFIPRSSAPSLKFPPTNTPSQTPLTGYCATPWLDHRSPNAATMST